MPLDPATQRTLEQEWRALALLACTCGSLIGEGDCCARCAEMAAIERALDGDAPDVC